MDYEKEIERLQDEKAKLYAAMTEGRCECCGRNPDRMADQRSLLVIESRIASLRSDLAADAGKVKEAREWSDIANKHNTNARQCARAWGNDQAIAIRELLDDQRDQRDEFADLRGKHFRKGQPKLSVVTE